MSIDERTRHELHQRLVTVLGAEQASTLMSYLPPVGWTDVATKSDLSALAERLEAMIHRGIAEVRGEMRGEIAELRGEMHSGFAGVRREMRGEIAELRGEMHSGFADVRHEIADVRSEFHRVMAAQLRTLFFALAGLMVTLVGLVLAAARLT